MLSFDGERSRVTGEGLLAITTEVALILEVFSSLMKDISCCAAALP